MTAYEWNQQAMKRSQSSAMWFRWIPCGLFTLILLIPTAYMDAQVHQESISISGNFQSVESIVLRSAGLKGTFLLLEIIVDTVALPVLQTREIINDGKGARWYFDQRKELVQINCGTLSFQSLKISYLTDSSVDGLSDLFIELNFRGVTATEQLAPSSYGRAVSY